MKILALKWYLRVRSGGTLPWPSPPTPWSFSLPCPQLSAPSWAAQMPKPGCLLRKEEVWASFAPEPSSDWATWVWPRDWGGERGTAVALPCPAPQCWEAAPCPPSLALQAAWPLAALVTFRRRIAPQFAWEPLLSHWTSRSSLVGSHSLTSPNEESCTYFAAALHARIKSFGTCFLSAFKGWVFGFGISSNAT